MVLDARGKQLKSEKNALVRECIKNKLILQTPSKIDHEKMVLLWDSFVQRPRPVSLASLFNINPKYVFLSPTNNLPKCTYGKRSVSSAVRVVGKFLASL